MISSSEINELSTALSQAQSEINDAFKDKKGYGYNYADLSQVLRIARPVLAKHKLAIIQSPTKSEKENCVSLSTRLVHASGQWIEDTVELPLQVGKGLSSAQAVGSTISYARRYALCAMIGITQSDNDASIHSTDQDYDAPKKTQSEIVMRKLEGKNTQIEQEQELVNSEQASEIRRLLNDAQKDESKFLTHFEVDSIEKLPLSYYKTAAAQLKKAIQKNVN